MSRPFDTAAIFCIRLKPFGATLLVGASAIVRKKKGIVRWESFARNGIAKPCVAWQRMLLTAAHAFRVLPAADISLGYTAHT